MDQHGVSLSERRCALEAAREALAGLDGALVGASGAELGQLLTLADEVAARATAACVVVTVEAVRRGEVAAAGVNTTAWVREHARSLRQGGAGAVARVATEVTGEGRRAGALAPDAGVPGPLSPVGLVWAGVREGAVSPGLAVAALNEVDRLAPMVTAEALPTVTRHLVDLGGAWGAGVMRRLRPRLVAQFGRPGEFDDLQERLVSAARLSTPVVASGDLTEYQLVMTPEQAAVLEAAVGPLSAPCPNEATGERDLRPAGQRRVEALAQVCARSSGVDAEASGGADGAAGSSAALHVTISLKDLEERTGCGEVLGSTATGVMLSPQVLRRVACDAALVPHVLGSAGEHLDLGRVVRLFTRAQRRRLWRRDGGCTFPGCTAPASWARAHHVRHWADGGVSDVDNAALLCQRHHTLVHRRRLWARVGVVPDERGRYVVWDLHEGSYDRHLERLRAEDAAADPPALTPERLAELVAALATDDPDEQRFADHELLLSSPDSGWDDEGWQDEPWADELRRERERAHSPL